MARARTNYIAPRIFFLLAFTIIIFIDFTNCRPAQLLKHKDGYIAVFIRHGDEPLENIDPLLAEAFNENNNEIGVVSVQHQNIDTIGESVIDNEKLAEITLDNLRGNSNQ